MLSNIWFIARTDLRFALRDRATLLWLILMPPVFFFFIGNMTAGGIGTMATESRVAIEAQVDDPVSARFAELVAENGFVIDTGAERKLTIGNGRARYDAGEPTPTTRIEELRLQKAALMLRAESAVVTARDNGTTLADIAGTEPTISRHRGRTRRSPRSRANGLRADHSRHSRDVHDAGPADERRHPTSDGARAGHAAPSRLDTHVAGGDHRR